jgi:SAM-dependent methyltransferase
VDRALISAIAHRWHPVAAPVSDDNVRRLVARLDVPDGGRVLDLGCGYGEWLHAALEAFPGAEGVGVDTSTPALEEARSRAGERKLTDRVTFEQADASEWEGGEFDAVLCVGATHALGGLVPTLTAARKHLRPGGRLLLGDGFWETPPTPETLSALEAEAGDFANLPDLVVDLERFGYEPGFGHVSSAAEWDDYEWSWTGSVATWALTEAADKAAALDAARTHRRQWLTGYRGQLGFVTFVLHDLGEDGAPD